MARGLQREDYSELPHLQAHNGAYRVLVNDELAETDYTDRLELLSVDHRAGTSVGIDDSGKLYSLNALQAPLSARDENGADLLPWLASADRRIWETPPASTPGGQLRHEIQLTFSKPADAATAKLLVHAGTGEWGLRMLNTLFELYGQDLESKLASLDSNPIDAQALKLWSATEDLYALKVWVEEPSGWQMRGMIPGGGMGARVVQLDVSRVKGDQVHIRLQPPAGFWAINSIAIDYSPEQNLEVNRIAPQSARTSAGKDVLAELQATDSRYYKAVKGDSASIAFAAPPARPGMSRTVFLHSNGYYRPDVRSQGPADNVTLSKIFQTRDGLARFAAERYAAWRLAPLALNNARAGSIMECAAPARAQDFEIVARRLGGHRWLARADAYSVARAFVNGEIEVQGDFIAAVRFQLSRSGSAWQRQFLDAVCRWNPWRLTQRWAGRESTARHIRFHYDRSNDFYRLFLDERMVYSCAYFNLPDASLDQAQAAKLDHICRKLHLQPGDRFLDIGCGWGALALEAAQQLGRPCQRLHSEPPAV